MYKACGSRMSDIDLSQRLLVIWSYEGNKKSGEAMVGAV